MPAIIQAAPTTLVVIATVYVAWSTGLLDAKRENLAAQNERLLTQRIALQQEENEIRAQVTSLSGELLNAQSELTAYKAEETAIRLVRKQWPQSTIEYIESSDDEYGFRIEIVDFSGQLVVTDGPEAAHADNRPHKISEALKAVGTMRNVRDLKITDIPLKAGDLEQIGSFAALKLLQLTRNAIDDDAMKHFPAMTELTNLSFFDQTFTDASSLSGCTNLTSLRFHGTPVGGNGLRALRSLQSLECIGLHTTSIADQEVPLLMEFPRLHFTSVIGTAITEIGILKLVSHPPLKTVTGHDGRVARAASCVKIKKRPLSVAGPALIRLCSFCRDAVRRRRSLIFLR